MMKYLVAPLILVALTACGEASQKPKGAAPGTSGVIPADPNSAGAQPVDLLSGTPTGSGSATSTGTVQGAELSPTAAFFDVLGTQNASGQNPVFMAVVVSTRADTCTNLLANQAGANSTNLVLLLNPHLDLQKPAATSVVQTYPVTDPNASTTSTSTGSLAVFQKGDSSCKPSASAAGLSGTVQVQSASYTDKPAAQGTFDIQFGASSDQVKGDFTAAPCPGLAALLAAQLAGATQTQATCVP